MSIILPIYLFGTVPFLDSVSGFRIPAFPCAADVSKSTLIFTFYVKYFLRYCLRWVFLLFRFFRREPYAFMIQSC